MRIVIATPLYPPDIADPAPYVKELAHRLVGGANVTVVTYSTIPEEVQGVKIISIPKHSFVLIRVSRFIFALLRTSIGADMLYVQTGISSELPASIVSSLLKIRLLIRIDSGNAEKQTRKGLLADTVRRFLIWRARAVVKSNEQLIRPEILPLEPRPDDALALYDQAWAQHVTDILTA